MRRDLVRGLLILLLALACLFLAAAGAIAASISGPPFLRVLGGIGAAVLLYPGCTLYRRGWARLRFPGEPSRRRLRPNTAGRERGRESVRRRRDGSANHTPQSAIETFARLAWLRRSDRRTVTGYLLIGLPPVLGYVCLAVFAVAAAGIDLAGGSASITWVPPWLGVCFQLVSLLGVVVLGTRARGDPQTRFAAFAMPFFVALFSAMIERRFALPAAALALTWIVALAFDLNASRNGAVQR